MSNALTISADITVVSTGVTYNTLDDWGLAISNTDYIGEPDVEETLIYIPGRSGYIDLSETIAGHPVYTRRKISINVGGMLDDRLRWDNMMSVIRNAIHGQVVRIVFSNDLGYYWQGRCEVTGFKRDRNLGKFNIELKDALPFKYAVVDSQESWLWDPFDFEDGVIPGMSNIDISGETTVTILAGTLPVNPVICVNSMSGTRLLVTWSGGSERITHTGDFRLPDMWVYNNDTITFDGNANVTIKYRSASL